MKKEGSKSKFIATRERVREGIKFVQLMSRHYRALLWVFFVHKNNKKKFAHKFERNIDRTDSLSMGRWTIKIWMNKTFLSKMKICLFTCWCISNGGTYILQQRGRLIYFRKFSWDCRNMMDKTLSHEWGRVWWIFKGVISKVMSMWKMIFEYFTKHHLDITPSQALPHSPTKIHFALCSSFITKDDNKMHWNWMKTRRNEK